jgi:hypothetical protein
MVSLPEVSGVPLASVYWKCRDKREQTDEDPQ